MSFIYPEMAQEDFSELGLLYEDVCKLIDSDDFLSCDRSEDQVSDSSSMKNSSTSSEKRRRARLTEEERKQRKNQRSVALRQKAKVEKDSIVQLSNTLSDKLNSIVLHLHDLIKTEDARSIEIARAILEIIDMPDSH